MILGKGTEGLIPHELVHRVHELFLPSEHISQVAYAAIQMLYSQGNKKPRNPVYPYYNIYCIAWCLGNAEVWVIAIMNWKQRQTNKQPTHTVWVWLSIWIQSSCPVCLYSLFMVAVSISFHCTDHSYGLLITDCFPFLQSLKRETNYPTTALKDVCSAPFLKILQKEVTVTNPSSKDFTILTFYPESTCSLFTQCRHFYILKLFINYLCVFKPSGSQSREQLYISNLWHYVPCWSSVMVSVAVGDKTPHISESRLTCQLCYMFWSQKETAFL